MTTQTPDAVREALEQRKAINTVLGRLLAPLVPDVVERIRIGNEACTAILAALDSRAGDAGEDTPTKQELTAVIRELRASYGRPEHAETISQRRAMVKADAILARVQS